MDTKTLNTKIVFFQTGFILFYWKHAKKKNQKTIGSFYYQADRHCTSNK